MFQVIQNLIILYLKPEYIYVAACQDKYTQCLFKIFEKLVGSHQFKMKVTGI